VIVSLIKIGTATGPTLLKGFSEFLSMLSIFKFRSVLNLGFRILKVMLLRICDFHENRARKASLSIRLLMELHLYPHSETVYVKRFW